jgi:crotonobetainyl-CoA:carnitine CoA-transferase CaiB-like acyl-CoA transferase
VPTPPILFEGKATSFAADSPALGQHSVEILQELGFEQARIEALCAEGSVACN